jgi:heme/copper-type cytochrome/quinol oxidase subunit 3
VLVLNPFLAAVSGTFFLLGSSATITCAHAALINGDRRVALDATLETVYLSALFIFLQWFEYFYVSKHINDSVYGSIFFLMTGFHGFHVIIGTIFLGINASRLFTWTTFTRKHHFGFMAAL